MMVLVAIQFAHLRSEGKGSEGIGLAKLPCGCRAFDGQPVAGR